MRRSSKAVLLVGLFVGSSLTGCASSSTIASPQQLALGKRVYEQQCASCHGAQGEGQYPDAPYKKDSAGLIAAPPHNATGHTWHHAAAQLKQIVQQGLIVQDFEPMPAFGDKLSEEEIDAVLAYLKTWWKPEQIEFQATVSARYTPATPRQ